MDGRAKVNGPAHRRLSMGETAALFAKLRVDNHQNEDMKRPRTTPAGSSSTEQLHSPVSEPRSPFDDGGTVNDEQEEHTRVNDTEPSTIASAGSHNHKFRGQATPVRARGASSGRSSAHHSAVFSDVHAHLSYRGIEEVATNERRKWERGAAIPGCRHNRHKPGSGAPSSSKSSPRHPPHVTIEPPLHGSYNLVFPLRFCDGLRWVIKIPANGTPTHWNAPAQSAITCEATTMRALRRNTSIPLPDVVAFCADTDNPVGCPYVVMTFVEGIPLHHVWFGHRHRDLGMTHDQVRAARFRALEELAGAMVQLARFAYDQAGATHFIDDAATSRVVEARRPVFDDDAAEEADTTTSPRPLRFQNEPIHTEPQSFFRPSPLPSRASFPSEAAHAFARGAHALLHELATWIPEPSPSSPSSRPFVLTHPDLDWQNVLVTPEGHIQGIIDWDGVMTAPRSAGNEGYPSFLTRDWDEAMWRWDPARMPDDDDDLPLPSAAPHPHGNNDDKGGSGRGEDVSQQQGNGSSPPAYDISPTDLVFYRRLYDTFMARLASPARRACPHLTRMSLVTESLALATHDPSCRAAVLRKVLGECWRVGTTASGGGAVGGRETGGEGEGGGSGGGRGGEEFTEEAFEMVVMERERVGADVMACLRRGFELLTTKEGF